MIARSHFRPHKRLAEPVALVAPCQRLHRIAREPEAISGQGTDVPRASEGLLAMRSSKDNPRVRAEVRCETSRRSCRQAAIGKVSSLFPYCGNVLSSGPVSG